MVQGYVDELNAPAQPLGDDQEVSILLDHDLTVEDGELTPSLKVKRKVVEDNYKDDDRRALRADPWRPPGGSPERAPARRPRDRMAGMPSALPEGDPAPDDGSLPAVRARRASAAAVRVLRARAVLLGALRLLRLQHLHRRASSGDGPAPRGRRTRDAAIAEVRLRPRGCSATPTCRCDTVFFGGGTPTLLPPADLTGSSPRSRDEFGLADGAEVTTEANPDSVTADDLARLRAGGFNRISFGMQSAVPHVLRCSTAPTTRAGARRSCEWARRGRVRAGQPRPDLRHAGGVARRLARPPSTRRWPASPTTSGRTP